MTGQGSGRIREQVGRTGYGSSFRDGNGLNADHEAPLSNVQTTAFSGLCPGWKWQAC